MENTTPAPADRTVYVKAVLVNDLPRNLRDQAEGLDQIYAVHDAEGQLLALLAIASWRSTWRGNMTMPP